MRLQNAGTGMTIEGAHLDSGAMFTYKYDITLSGRWSGCYGILLSYIAC